MSLTELFDRGAELHAERPFVIDGNRRLSHREAAELSHRIAAALHAAGITSRRAAAVLSPNSALGLVAMVGIFRSGAAWVPLNARNDMASNAAFLRLTEAKALFFHSSFEQDIPALLEVATQVDTLVCIDRSLERAPALLDWAAGGPETVTVARDPSSVAVLMGTGGTTGEPKAVMLTHRNFATMAANFLAAMPCDEPPVHLMAAPMTHGAGFVAFPLMAEGATHVIHASVEPAAVLRAIESERVTHLFLPPTAIYALLSHPRIRDYDYSSLRHLIYAAAPMSVDKLKEALDVFGPVMTQVFGQAEAPLMCTFMGPREHVAGGDLDHERRLWSCGRRTMFTPVAIMDDDGGLLGAGERGEIVVGGDLVMDGYWRDAEATRMVTAGTWHRTGDIGYRDADGYVYIVDRKRDLIISGGFNVFPSEVEQVIWGHPGVRDCAVVGVPDPKWGEAVTAVVEPKPGCKPAAEEIIARCRAVLGGVKAPKAVEFWDELPRSPVGKVLKREIRDTFWIGEERAV